MVQKIKRKVMYSRAFRRLILWSKRITPPGFEGFNIYEISKFFFTAVSQGHITTRASAIAFKIFLASFPAVLVILTLIPYVPIADFQDKLLVTFRGMLPLEVYRFIEGTLEDLVVNKHGTLLSVSFVLGVFIASNSVSAILQGFSRSTNVTQWHSALRERMLSLGLMLALSVLAVLAVPILTLSGIAIRKFNDMGFFASEIQVVALFAVKWAVSVMLVIMAVSLLYNAGDPSTKRFKVFTPGSLLAVVLILLVSQALAFVFSSITDLNALYGSLGAIVAVQVWIYLNMIVLLIGYELNISIVRARSKRSEHLQLRKGNSA